jgi:hypothetical protein
MRHAESPPLRILMLSGAILALGSPFTKRAAKGSSQESRNGWGGQKIPAETFSATSLAQDKAEA